MTNHTAGPWHVDRTGDHPIVYDRDGMAKAEGRK